MNRIEDIRHHKNRTGWSAKKATLALRKLGIAVTEKEMMDIFSGRAGEIKDSVYEGLNQTMVTAPDRIKKTEGELIEITPEFRQKLKEEIKRTGCSVQYAMKYSPDHPDKPTLSEIKRLTSQKTKIFPRNKAEFVFEHFANRSDKPSAKTNIIIKEGEPISKEDLEKMKLYRDILNLLPGHIFNIFPDVPEGLSSSLVSSWLNEYTKSAMPGHVEWVLEHCEKAVEQVIKHNHQCCDILRISKITDNLGGVCKMLRLLP